MSSSRSIVARALSAVVLLASFGFVAAGCHNDHKNHSTVEVTSEDFYYEIDVRNYDATEEYFWNSQFEFAFVEFEGLDIDGEVVIEIFDDADDLIYARSFFGNHTDFFELDETLEGFPGLWVIRISFFDVDGSVFLNVY